ncbi:MAG: acylphosphatase [Comamonadaceae bacterium]|nr:acylphosphatase [Comamonadaceae bacterium]
MSAELLDTARHLRIFGHVQGVYYRQSTIAQALQRGLRGWVRNRSDGTVEALVCGPQAQVQALIDWAHQGPSAAQVERVEVSAHLPEPAPAAGFVQRETL